MEMIYMANNAKLSFEQIKDVMRLFHSLKMNSLQIGDLVLTKVSYDPEGEKGTVQEDPLFFSAPHLPPDVQALLQSMNPTK